MGGLGGKGIGEGENRSRRRAVEWLISLSLLAERQQEQAVGQKGEKPCFKSGNELGNKVH